MPNLDLLDRRILLELDRNSRQSVSALARKIRQGRDRIEYRIQRLIDQKIIRNFVASINLYKLGFTIFKSYLRLENNKARSAEFIAYLHKHPRVYWLALCDGGWDLVIAIFAKSAREFYDIHNIILSEFNEVVLNFNAYTLIEFRIYSRNYLVKSTRSSVSYSQTQEPVTIDETDFEILRLLARDARMTARAIAERLNITPHLAHYRIERLEREGVIGRYQVELNLDALQMMLFKSQFFIRNYELSLREKFIEYCEKHPNVIYYMEQIGDCNIEVEFEVRDYKAYAHIIEEIRGEFSKLVRNFTTILIREASWYTVPTDIPEGIIAR